MASAQRGQGAHGDRRLAECQLRNDGRPAPGGDQGQDGWELHADIPGRDGDGGLGREPLQGLVACGAGRPGHPGPPGEVPEAARCDLPVRRDDQEIGVEGELAQAKARLGGRGARGVVFGEHDVQVSEAQFRYGSRTVAFGDDGPDRRVSGGEGAQGGADQWAHHALEGGDPYRARRLAGQLGQIALGLAQLRGDDLAMSGQQPSGRGQRHLPAGPVDEAGAGLPFQCQQLLGDRGRGQVQCAGRGGHAAVRGDRLQHTQPARIDHPEVLLSLYGSYFTFTFISRRATMSGMTDAKGMIVRSWSATSTSAGAGDYGRYFADTLLPQLRELPGFAGAYLLSRDLGDAGPVELTACTFWESAEAIRGFTGDDITVSVVEPEARAMLLDFDRTAAHRSVLLDARG